MSTTDTEQLNFYVSTQLKQRLRAYATTNGISMSGAARMLLTKALDRDERPSGNR